MIITKTPLRISLAGGGTDINTYYRTGFGAVVSMSIDKYIWIAVNPKFDNRIRISYSQTEIVDEIKDLQHEIVKECLQMTGIDKGIEIVSIADIPAGTGLGSSSCFTVGVLNALYNYTGKQLTQEQLAEKACEIEINILKHPIGKQDQYGCSCGGLNYFQFNQDESVCRQKIFLPEEEIRKLNQNLIMFYTGKTRNANNILETQKAFAKRNEHNLDLMKQQAIEIKNMLRKEGVTDKLGYKLHQGWLLKQSLVSDISNSDISYFYDLAIKNGAIGGKLLGAGGGGFLLFYCEPKFQDQIRKALPIKETIFNISQYGSRLCYAD